MGQRSLLTVLVALGVSFAAPVHAQVELTGTFVRYLAVGDDGSMICSFGSCAGRSMQYAESTSDTPSCDLYYPGSPVEGFTLEATPAAGASSRISNGGFTTTSAATVSGRTITWAGTGTFGSTTVRINQTFELQTADRFVRLTVTVTNTGTSALSDVYYLRNGDPDHGSCSIGSDYSTYNDVRRQPPADDAALTTARAGDAAGADRTLVLGIGAHDPRARAHNGGFDNTEASVEWNAPIDRAGALEDIGVDLIFREPSLAAGASTTFEMFYVWGRTESEVETRFDELGFPAAPCEGVAEGGACTTSRGAAGLCRAGRCCTGCWNGTRCQAGSAASACGSAGVACVSCSDGIACTSDVCTAGVCSNPNAPAGTSCDDGLFCTATDTCNGAGTCGGTGARCDDREDCTTDSCDEAMDRCVNAGHPEGTACVSGVAAGVCRSARCCSGCWDGAVCQSGTSSLACGVTGAACASCSDGDACTTDVCSTGTCSNPRAPVGTACNDGLYCTTVDRCDVAGACVGGGAPRCDDGASCTLDTCDEDADRCVFTPASGCIIGGTCVIEGTTNPTYPCQVCDPARNPSDWSGLPVGTECGAPRCSSGRLVTRTCDVSGTCVINPSVRCPTGTCASMSACESGCAAGGCPVGQHCDPVSMECEPLRNDGAACASASACESGRCVDGVCCASECAGTCERCDLSGVEGTCTAVPAGDDPDDECVGACDGVGDCASMPDAGSRPDAGPRDAGTERDASMGADASTGVDAGTTVTVGGCGCRATDAGRPAPLGLFAVALVLALVRRRRR